MSSLEPAPTVTFTHREILRIISGLLLCMFLAAIDQTILGAALPRLAADLGGAEDISWVISAYLLASTAVTPIYGKLSDLYGRRIMVQSAVLIFLVASVLCALATSMPQLIAFRTLQGVGGGGLSVLAQSTLADVVSPRQRGRYQGYFAAVWLVASMIGPALGGFLADHLSWRWMFWVNIPFGIAAMLIAQSSLRALAVKRIRHKIDYLSALLIVTSVTCVLLVTTLGGADVPWDSTLIMSLIAAAVILLVLAVVQELKASEPVLPPRLFRRSAFLISNLACVLYSMTVVGSVVFLPSFFQMVYGLDASRSGVMMMPFLAAAPLSVIISGRVVARTGRYKVFPVVGLFLATTGMVFMSFVTTSTPVAFPVAYMTLVGVGIGLVGPILLVTLQNAIDWRDIGAGTAAFNFFRTLGSSFGVTMFGMVLIARLNGLVGALPGFPQVAGEAPGITLLHAGVDALNLAPEALRNQVAAAVTQAFGNMFLSGAVVTGLAFLIVIFVKEVPLKTKTGAAERAEATLPDK